MPFEITRPLDQLKAEAKARVNVKAGETITARLPIWKQNNFTARSVELLDKKGQRTAQEQAEWDAMQTEWDWVKSIRAQSNTATAAIDAATSAAEIRAAELASFAEV